jgi:hypothetical protein
MSTTLNTIKLEGFLHNSPTQILIKGTRSPHLPLNAGIYKEVVKYNIFPEIC